MHSRVAALVENVGREVTIKRVTSTYNSATRQSTETLTDTPVKAFISNNLGNKQTLTGIIPENSKIVNIAAQDLSFTPRPNLDKIRIDSKDYTICSCDVRHIGNTSALLVLMVTLDGN